MTSAPPSTDGQAVFERIREARRPEDVFGMNPSRAKAAFRALARATHPDRNPDAGAEETYTILAALWEQAQVLIKAGVYGTPVAAVTVATKRTDYLVLNKIGKGDVADVFACRDKTGAAGVFKVSRKPARNSVIKHEARMLKRVWGELKSEQLAPFLPNLVETFGFKQSGGIARAANVFERVDGLYTLEQVMERYPDGIDPRDMAWIWRRLLAILGGVHDAGVTHAAVLPPHILIHPEQHGLVLVGWGQSVLTGDPVERTVSRYGDWYPHEVKEGMSGPETDIFMGARTMRALMGTKPVPTPLRAFFRACDLRFTRRPDEAWPLQHTFNDVLERVYGRRVFRPFTMAREA